MSDIGIYTRPGVSPTSWASVRRDIQRASERDFKRHASKFYKGRKGPGLLGRIFRAIKGTGQHRAKKVYQRPGNIGLGQEVLMPPPTAAQKQAAQLMMYAAIGMFAWMMLGAPGLPAGK